MYVQLADFKMAYTDAGRGTPVLFIHGYPLNRAMWQPQVEGLSDVARLLAPDLRGFGDSQPVPGPYSMDLFADDLNAFLDALEVSGRLVVCGLSMGGYVAFAFCRKYARRLRGLILTSTRAAADTPQGKALRDEAAELAGREGVAPIVEGMLPKLLSLVSRESQPGLVADLLALMSRTSQSGMIGSLMAMKERPDSTSTLGQIGIPTLVVHGADDAIVPLAEAGEMAAAIPGARLEVIPGAGHLPNMENPEAYNRVVSKFLASLEPEV